MLIIPCAGEVGVNPNITFIKDGTACYHLFMHQASMRACEAPVPGIRK